MSEATIRTLTRESEDLIEDVAADFSIDGALETRGLRRLPRGALRESSDDTTFWEETYLPVNLDSVEALRFVGMKKNAAHLILQRFRTRSDRPTFPDRDEVFEILGFVEGHIAGRTDAFKEEDDWDSALKGMGVRRSTREGILHQDFTDLRLTQSAKEWALETIRDGWTMLVSLDKTVRRRKHELHRHAQRRHLDHHEAATPNDTEEGQIPILATTTAPPLDENEYNFFLKGGEKTRLTGLYTEASPSALDIELLFSEPPTDFSRDRRLLYLTKQRDLALKYAAYASTRMPYLDAGILHLAVAKTLLPAPQQVVDADWYNLVWGSRGRETVADEDSECLAAQVKFEDAEILVGACCCENTKKIRNLSKKEDMRKMKLNGGESAEQWVFMTRNVRKQLATHCRDKIWWELTHPAHLHKA
jgi:hypothetical protein